MRLTGGAAALRLPAGAEAARVMLAQRPGLRGAEVAVVAEVGASLTRSRGTARITWPPRVVAPGAAHREQSG